MFLRRCIFLWLLRRKNVMQRTYDLVHQVISAIKFTILPRVVTYYPMPTESCSSQEITFLCLWSYLLQRSSQFALLVILSPGDTAVPDIWHFGTIEEGGREGSSKSWEKRREGKGFYIVRAKRWNPLSYAIPMTRTEGGRGTATGLLLSCLNMFFKGFLFCSNVPTIICHYFLWITY